MCLLRSVGVWHRGGGWRLLCWAVKAKHVFWPVHWNGNQQVHSYSEIQLKGMLRHVWTSLRRKRWSTLPPPPPPSLLPVWCGIQSRIVPCNKSLNFDSLMFGAFAHGCMFLWSSLVAKSDMWKMGCERLLLLHLLHETWHVKCLNIVPESTNCLVCIKVWW